jgi:hypothetical protein
MEQGRRLKLWVLSERVLTELSWGGKYTIESGIPHGARLLSVNYDVSYQGFIFVFEHDSFPPVPEHLRLETEGWFRVIRGHGPRGTNAVEQQITELTDRDKRKWIDWLIAGAIGAALTVGVQYLTTLLQG